MDGRRFALRVVLALLVLGLFASAATGAEVTTAEAPGSSSTAPIRVGTFLSRPVALAYGRSPAFMQYVADLKARAKRAEEDGDEELLEELTAEGSGQQERLHLQVFSDAPIDDILDKLADVLPGVAREAGVEIIVAETTYASEAVEFVDVTDLLVREFDPTEETLELVEEVKRTPPVDASELTHDH